MDHLSWSVSYDALQRRLALLEGIARGETAFSKGRTRARIGSNERKALRRDVASQLAPTTTGIVGGARVSF